MCYRDYIDASVDARLSTTKRMFDRIVAGTSTVMHPALDPLEHVVPVAQQLAPPNVQQHPPTVPVGPAEISITEGVQPVTLQFSTNMHDVRSRLNEATHNTAPAHWGETGATVGMVSKT